MAYDQQLADRVRDHLAGQAFLSERSMFGGISFLVQGNFCVGVVKDDLCVRVGPHAYDDALAQPHARPMDFTGKPTRGWVFVGPEGLKDPAPLNAWINRGLRFALTLPPK
jgi:hypothetical protein